MMKSVFSILKKSFVDKQTTLIRTQSLRFHRVAQEAKSLPRIISDGNSLDEFQYFSIKIRDLMDKEQLDYFENVIRKVEHIEHPVAELMRAKIHSPMFDLIMKLITQMANDGKEVSPKQQSLSNAVQLIHIGNLVHQGGISDLSKMPNFGNNLPADHDLILGNKIALLAGDFLLASAQIKITQMRDAELLRIISSAMCDIIDSNFIGKHDKNDTQLPFKPGQIPKLMNESFEDSGKPVKLEGNSGTAEDEWMFRQIIHRGFLIAKGCQASAVIARKSIGTQKNCFELAKYLFLSWKSFVEIESFKNENCQGDFRVNLISAPVLFHLSHEPNIYDTIVNESNSSNGIDDANLRERILNGPGLNSTRILMAKLIEKTHQRLQNFPSSDEKLQIENILADFK